MRRANEKANYENPNLTPSSYNYLHKGYFLQVQATAGNSQAQH